MSESTSTLRRRGVIGAMTLFAALALGACGSDDDGSSFLESGFEETADGGSTSGSGSQDSDGGTGTLGNPPSYDAGMEVDGGAAGNDAGTGDPGGGGGDPGGGGGDPGGGGGDPGGGGGDPGGGGGDPGGGGGDPGGGGGDPGGGGGDPGGGGGTPRGPAELMIYTANVENLPRTSDTCQGDWKDLYAYMATQTAKPDVFLVQQLSDSAQLQQLTAHMTATLGRPYLGVIAEATPTAFNSPCGATKDRQTNAIVFAADRMQAATLPHVWKSYKNVNGSCVLNDQSRARGIALKLLDMQSNEYVSVASIHWSTANGSGADPACAVANARHTDQVLRVHHPDASLYVFGGDTNEPDTLTHTTSAPYNGWYAEANGDLNGALGYMDPIWRKCQNDGNLRQCLVSNWTFRGANADRRIDFLFARLPSGMPSLLRAHTVTFNEAGAADKALTGTDSAIGYSDHRAVLTRLSY